MTLITALGVSRKKMTAMQLSHVEAITSFGPVKYIDNIDEPSNIPNPTAHLRPSRSIPANIPENASRLI
ncbi:hypothetical protein D3C77_807880 [compost metagenome]